MSLAAYLALKLAAVVVRLPPAVDLALLPAGVCALGLAAGGRNMPAGAAAEEGEDALAAFGERYHARLATQSGAWALHSVASPIFKSSP